MLFLRAGNGSEAWSGWSRILGQAGSAPWSLWQPLQSQQDPESRAWEAAEAEEEGDEGSGVKAGRADSRDEATGAIRVTAVAQGLCSSGPALEQPQGWRGVSVGLENGSVLLSLPLTGMHGRQGGELDPELAPAQP